MTTPAGYPFWQRGRTPALYGGTSDKRDYGGIGAVNSQTDVTAAQFLRLCSDVSAIANMSPICTLLFTWRPLVGVPLVTFISCPWADPITVSYAGDTPPSALYPTVVQDTDTRCVVTLPSSATDQFGVSGSIIARMVMVALGTSSGTGVWWEGPTGDSSFVINWFIPLTQDVQTVVW